MSEEFRRVLFSEWVLEAKAHGWNSANRGYPLLARFTLSRNAEVLRSAEDDKRTGSGRFEEERIGSEWHGPRGVCQHLAGLVQGIRIG